MPTSTAAAPSRPDATTIWRVANYAKVIEISPGFVDAYVACGIDLLVEGDSEARSRIIVNTNATSFREI